MVSHTIAGVGFTAFVVTTAIVGLSSPAGQQVAVAEPVLATPAVPSVELTSASEDDLAAAAARAAEQSAEQAKLAATAAKLSSQRAKTLARRGKSVTAQEAKLKAAAAKAAAERARARAAALKAAAERARAEAERLKAEAEAAAQRRRALANRGYLPGTTDPREIARQIMQNKYGLGPSQFSCFDNIIMRESKWDVHATNPSSGAYGIPQALPGSKMATIAPDWHDNPATQIIWGIEYMNNRYGSPCEAWAFKSAHGWY